MAETVGSIDYEVSFDTSKLIKGQRDIDSQLKKTTGSFDKFGSGVSSAASSIKPMTAAVGGALATIGALSAAMVKAADDMRMLSARVDVAAGSAAAGAAAMKALADISRETQTAITANVDVFARLNSSIMQMGGTQGDTLRLTDLLAKAIKSSGASAQEASAAMLQFGQALGSGKLAGDELRSLMETAPYLMKQLADGIGAPVGALKKLGEEGKLTADVVVEAMSKATDKINSDFEKLPRTLSGAITVMTDEFNRLALAMDDNSRVGEVLSGVVEGVGRVMQQITADISGARTESDALARNSRITEWADDTENSLLKMASRVQFATIALSRLGKVVYHMQRMEYGQAFEAVKSSFDPIVTMLDKAEQRAAALKSLGKYTGDIGTADRTKAAAKNAPFSKLTPAATPQKPAKTSRSTRSSGSRAAAREEAKARADEEKKALAERTQMWTSSQQELNDEMELLQSGSDITAAFKGLDPVASLKAEYDAKLAMVSQYEQLMAMQGVDATAEATAAKLEMERAYNEQKTIMDEERFRAQSEGNELMMASLDAFGQASTNALAGLLSGTMSVKEAMSGLANTILNEAVGSLVQMGIQQIKTAMISKSVAAANGAMYAGAVAAQVATNTALAGQAAFAATAAIPMVGPVMAPAAAAAASAAAGAIGSPAIATAAAAGRKYGGPVSSGEMYRVGEGGKPEMFVGSNGENYMIPGKGGKVVGHNALTGGGTVVNITVNNDGSSSAGSGQDGAQLGRMIEGAVVAVINREKRPGGILS